MLAQFLAARSTWGYEGTLLLEQNTQRQFLTLVTRPGSVASLRRMHVPKGDATEHFPALGEIPGVDPCDIGDSYMASVEAGGTVAGLDTWRLTMRPRDNLRFGYIMDLDQESGLPLRVATFAPEGPVIERYEFATIRVSSAEAPSSVESATVEPLFSMGQLPPGFSKSTRFGSANHIVVSDGLATASVFLEPLPEALKSGEGTVRHGSTVTYTRGVRLPAAGWLITVIGEVPVNTARLLAASVRLPDRRLESMGDAQSQSRIDAQPPSESEPEFEQQPQAGTS